MEFYEEISRYYDYIFPVNQTQLNFFQSKFAANNVDSVLDIACGTGNYSIEFAKWGLQVLGVDLEERMIKEAEEKGGAFKNLTFKVGNMTNLPLESGTFKACLCIGNSLPHLVSVGDLKKAIAEMYRILAVEGIAVIQIVNYDRILQNRIKELPLIVDENQGLRFTRFYDFRPDGLIDFNTSLEVSHEGKTKSYENSIPLRPLTQEQLIDLFNQTGFKEFTFFGAFDGREFNLDSPATIFVAKK